MTTLFLVAQESDERAERILHALGRELSPGKQRELGSGDTARVRHPLPPDEARADVAARLDAVDTDWRRYVALL